LVSSVRIHKIVVILSEATSNELAQSKDL
jgi:hypothetical protein